MLRLPEDDVHAALTADLPGWTFTDGAIAIGSVAEPPEA